MIKDWLYKEYSTDLPDELIDIFERSHIQKRWYGQASLIVHRYQKCHGLHKENCQKKLQWVLQN